MDTHAFWIAAGAAALWGYGDFHAPHRPAELRGAVSPRRYRFAVAVYVLGATAAFAVLAELADAAAELARGARSGGPADGGPPPSPAAPAAALLALVALPFIPWAREGLAALRRWAQALALYPAAAERLAALLGQAEFQPRPDARDRLLDELRRYGVPPDAPERHLSEGALRALDQVETLRAVIEARGEGGPSPLRLFAERAAAAGPALAREHRRLLRRASRALLLAGAVENRAGGKLGRREAATLSDFVAEEAETLLASYRRLAAEAALSSRDGPEGCRRLLTGLGYAIDRLPLPLDLALPFWPVAASFIVVLMPLALLPYLMPLLGMALPAPAGPRPLRAPDRLHLMLVASLAQAAMHALSIAWALYPKAVTNRARPSLRALPWRSYLVFGAASYATGAALTAGVLWLFPAMPLARAGALGIAAASLIPLAMTVGVALLTDRHLLRPAAQPAAGRRIFDPLDGLALAAVLAAADMAIQALLRPAPVWLWALTAIFAAIGFAIGGLVPSTAAAHLTLHEAAAAGAAAPEPEPEPESVRDAPTRPLPATSSEAPSAEFGAATHVRAPRPSLAGRSASAG